MHKWFPEECPVILHDTTLKQEIHYQYRTNSVLISDKFFNIMTVMGFDVVNERALSRRPSFETHIT